ncbi:hypothetical protein [Antrihabitans sp. YC2-6]|uniref:hypothetical protein n=1 Tax=Antrihabitans sp. YC2-6 TaxID=2799498 RepID=UPI0018F39975|nr:hypothetical protein [Antrihabitans sp. YC2-6]MBJ8343964.1 hypothetical protein [Antrihabitans sp. YC2-6]
MNTEQNNKPEVPTNLKLLDYPKKWLKEEAFWKDIVTRTCSVLIASLIIYVVALGSGTISSPPVTAFLRGVVQAIGITGIAAAAGGLVIGHYTGVAMKKGYHKLAIGIVAVVGIVGLACTAYVLVDFIQFLFTHEQLNWI